MKKILFAAFACLMVLSMIVSPVSATKTWTEFEAAGAKVDDLGGEMWFSKDFTKAFYRNWGELYTLDADDARLSGEFTFIFSGNFKAADPPVFFYGPIWGSIRIDNDGGYWVGQWTGERNEQGFAYGFSVLKGHGNYAGMIAQVSWMRESPDPMDPIMAHGVIK